jgi:hypothetical protein
MEVQHVHVDVIDNKLQISYLIMVDVVAIQVSIAHDSEFTVNLHQFILPPSAQNCRLDPGKGSWYVRVGAWIGDSNGGKVRDSGVVGPFQILEGKEASKPVLSTYSSSKIEMLEKGFRLYTYNPNPNYMVLELSEKKEFPSSETKAFFEYDWGKGFVEIKGVNEYLTYNIRYTPFSGYPSETPFELPIGQIIEQKKALPPVKIRNNEELVQKQSEQTLLRESKENRNLRFSSYSDYMRLMAARAKR